MDPVDISQVLRDAENALRDFIAFKLQKSIGDSWIERCGVSPARIEKWKERKEIEEKKQVAGVVEERLIYYADFYDLTTILKHRWPEDFSEVFGKWKEMEVWLSTLEDLRNPEAHRRELLPHQKQLAAGIAGDIRTRIVRYRSKDVGVDNYFARIESARDNHGNLFTAGESGSVNTGIVLHPGEDLEFIITASDPYGQKLQYGLLAGSGLRWQDSNEFALKITADHIGREFTVIFYIRSERDYHAHRFGQWGCDDFVVFTYTVLPSR
ncbi:MAG: Swt1 family HEPN domain-containing protein [Candidatus Zixiibacteriota bacterium]